MPDPIEMMTRYATTVDDISEAWAFVMDHLDLVGDDPSVEIQPTWSFSIADIDREVDEVPRRFSVVVSGTTDNRKEKELGR
jgi:hypothetical protein